MSWCGQRKSSVRVVEADVPAGIMPPRINASLIDIKIGGKRGPDDALYNKSQVIPIVTGLLMGHGVRCAIPHFCIFATYTQLVSPNLEPESALDGSC